MCAEEDWLHRRLSTEVETMDPIGITLVALSWVLLLVLGAVSVAILSRVSRPDGADGQVTPAAAS
jgi:hypothetical protein